MKTAYLTSGPRGAGKSTYVSLIKEIFPEILVIDRDKLFTEKFGDNSFDPYSGTQITAAQFLKQHIEEVVTSANEDAKIILDAWNGFYYERLDYIKLLRNFGVERIACWYFITPLTVCLEWFMQKADQHGSSKNGYVWDYKLYHKEASDINHPDQEVYLTEKDEIEDLSFDIICRINPLQLILPGIFLT